MTNATKDFRNAEILDLGHGVEIVSYPAVDYLHTTNKPIRADEGGMHLGQRTAGIAVAFPTRTHGLMHKEFGLGVYDKDDSHGNKAGEPFAYGKGVSLTAHKRDKKFLAACHLGDEISYSGKTYRVERAPNDNISLIEV